MAGVFAVLVSMGAAIMNSQTAVAATGINSQINFQGKLTNPNGTNIPDGTYNIEFKLYTGGTGCVSSGTSPCGGTLQWTEDRLRNASNGVVVTNGIFQVNLGSVTSLPNIFNNDTIWLSINLGNTNATCTPFSSCGGDGEMLPFIRFTAAPYAINSDLLDGLDSSAFAQLNPSSAQSGSLSVTGSVTAATSLQSPLVDNTGTLGLGTGSGTTAVTVGRATSSTNLTLQGSASTSWSATGASGKTTVGFTAPSANTTLNFPASAAGTYTICTTDAGSCSATYQAAGSYIAKNATDTSTVSSTGTLLALSNTDTASGRVLDLTNASTGSTLNINSTGNPSASAAIIKVNNSNASPSGKFLDLQVGGTSRVSIDTTGLMAVVSTAAGNSVITTRVTGDTNDRLAVGADGKINFGTGAASTDAYISRSGVSGTPTLNLNVGSSGTVAVSNQATVSGGLQVGSPGFLGKLSVQSGAVGTVTIVSRGIASQTADQIQLQDSNGNINGAFNAAGNQLTLGRVAASGTVTQGKLSLSDGTTSNLSGTIQLAGAITAGGNITYSLPISTSTTQTICTTVASSCSSVYQAAGTYLAKDAADTSSIAGLAASAFGYTFSNTTSAPTSSGVLRLQNNNNTGPTLLVSSNATPAAGNALLKVNQTNASATGLLLDTQLNGTSQFSVDYAGNLSQVGGTSTTTTINGQRITSAANFTGTVTSATGISSTAGAINAVGGTIQTNNTNRINNNGDLVNIGNITGTAGITIATSGTGTGNILALQPATGSSLTGSVTKNSATGNEVAYDLSTIINKATSGNYTAFKLNVAETSAPGAANLLADLQVGGGSKFTVSNTGNVVTAGTLTVQGTGTTTVGGPVLFQAGAVSTTAFNIKTPASGTNGNLFTVDSTNGRVGINLGGTNTPNSTLEVYGTMRISSTAVENFTTPLNATVPTKINIPLYSPANYGQILAFGLPNCVDPTDATTNCTAPGSSQTPNTARGITVFDGRVGSANAQHQPSIGVISPSENDILGFTWDGQSTTGIIKTLDQNGSTGGVTVRSGESNGSGGTSGAVTIKSGNGVGTNSSTGNLTIDSGAKTGTGTAGNLSIGATNASLLTIGNSAANFTLQGAAGSGASKLLAVSGANSTKVEFATPTGTNTITVPDAGGTICTTVASTCGGTTGAYVALQSTTPGTAQTGNLNISGSGVFGTNITFTENAGHTIAIANRTTNAGGNLLTIQGSNGGAGASANAGGGITLQSGSGGGTGAADGGDITFQTGDRNGGGQAGRLIVKSGLGDRNDFLEILKNDNTPILIANSQSNQIYLGGTVSNAAYNLTFSADNVATDRTIGVDDSDATDAFGDGKNLVIHAGSTSVTNANGGSVVLTGGNKNGTGTVGGVLVKNVADSANAFKVQNAAGTSTVFSVDTSTSSAVTVGVAGSSIFKNNGATFNATCAYSGVTGNTTLNTASKTPDVCTTFVITTTGAGPATITVPAPTAGAGSMVYVSNSSASTFSLTLLSASIAPGSTATLVYVNGGWSFAGADAGSLQTAYNNQAGGTTPSIAVNTTKLGVTIQNSATNSLAAGTELFGVRAAAANDTTAGNSLLRVSSYGIGVNLSAASHVSGNDVQIGDGSATARTITVTDQATATNNGANLTVKAAAGNTSGTGGTLTLSGGAGGASGNGGAIAVNGGAGNGTGKSGGAVTITGANGTAGSGATPGGGAGAVSITAGNGGAGTGTNSTGAGGANVTITAGNGGAATGTGTNGTGGSITLQAGSVGTGGTGGAAGAINLTANTVNVGTAGVSIFKNNGATFNATCAYTGVTGATTLNTASKTPDVCTTFVITTTGSASITVPAPTAGAGSMVYVSNSSASSNTFTLLGASIGIGSTATLVYVNGAWSFAGADAGSLQTAYNNQAGSTTPSIAVNTTKLGVTIQNSATNSLAAGTELFGVRAAAANDTTLGSSLLRVSSYGIGINLGAATHNSGNDIQLGDGSTTARVITVTDQATAATAGAKLTVKAAAGNTSGAGGALELFGGTGGNSGIGGAVSVQGGAGGGGNTAGGAVTVAGGTASGIGTGGALNVKGGAASATAGSASGAASLSTQNGAAGSGATNGGGVGLLTIQGGTGGAGTGTNSLGATGGNITIAAGAGGASTGTAANANGGSITLSAGAAGTGGSGSAGVPGTVNIDTPVFIATTRSFTQTGNGQTFNIPVSDIDSNSTVVVNVGGAFTGATVTVPTPTNSTTGRIVYITNGPSSVAFTLSPSGSSAISMNTNSTATLVWNGSAWTAAGADASTSLQQVYNNTATSPASIVTTSTSKNILFQAGAGFDTNNLFQVNNSMGAQVLTVDTNNTGGGANLAQNAGGESGSTGWTAYTGSVTPTVTQTTTGSEVASGSGAIKVAFGSAGTGGVNNALNSTALATASTTYNVTFSIKAVTSAPTNANMIVEYYRNNTPTLDSTCSANSAATNPAITTTAFIKYTCYFTTTGNAKATTNFLRIRQADSVARSWMIDNLSIVAQSSNGAQNVGALKVGGATSQGLTLLTVDSYAAAPFATGSTINTDLLGSIYYDTTIGKLQCYEAKGWGSCGNSPNNSAFLIPEYPNAVLGAKDASTQPGVGTMTAGVCSGTSRLNINTSLCSATEDFNYYAWTSPQTASGQTYSIYVRYQLPATYNGFLDANTIKLVGRTTNTTDGSVAYSLFSASGSTSCGTSASLGTTTVTTSANTWQQVNLAADETSGSADCTFAANDIITFRIDLTAKNNATVYASNLTFTTKGL